MLIVKMQQQNNVTENFDNLEWGYYPISEDYNSGGCIGACEPEYVSELDRLRVTESQCNMEQRAGNNPIFYENIPAYTQYETGIGCYNSKCKCRNCQGMCSCGKAPTSTMPSSNPFFFSFHTHAMLMLLLGLVLLYLFFKRR